jgi:hypothetical protein
MPKATLTFNLPEEQGEYADAVHGGGWRSIVYNVSIMLRNALKYGHSYKSADEALEAIRTHLWDECKARNLDPWSD